MGRVVIGMDPHKRSATIEVIDSREQVLDQGRFGTDRDGYQAMLAAGRKHPDRVWAVEGCNGVGRHLAQRLVADGEPVVDVPAKLSARARVFSTGQGRKTDPVDAHSVALVGLRSTGLRVIAVDDATVALRLLIDRRDELGVARTQTVNRIHRLLLELLPGGAKKHLSAAQAKALLADGATARRRRANPTSAGREYDRRAGRDRQADQDRRRRTARAHRGHRLHPARAARHRPSGAARLLGDVGDITRFADKGTLRVLERHRPAGRLLRRSEPAPALPSREPADQPGAAHHGPRPRCATAVKAAPTTTAKSPPARPTWKRCAA